jgi:hypothetical protein
MSSLLNRMQKNAGEHIGLLSSKHRIRGAKLGVHNEHAKDLLAREARRRKKSLIEPRADRRSKNSIRWLERKRLGKLTSKRKPNVAQSPPLPRERKAKGWGKIRRASIRKARLVPSTIVQIAPLNRRGLPHEHKREIARNTR